MKRTELKRKSPLQATALLYRTERVPLVKQLLAERPVCERCRSARSDDVHELKSRARGGSIVDPANCVCLCRKDHDWITTHPKEAAGEGWVLASWQSAS